MMEVYYAECSCHVWIMPMTGNPRHNRCGRCNERVVHRGIPKDPEAKTICKHASDPVKGCR